MSRWRFPDQNVTKNIFCGLRGSQILWYNSSKCLRWNTARWCCRSNAYVHLSLNNFFIVFLLACNKWRIFIASKWTRYYNKTRVKTSVPHYLNTILSRMLMPKKNLVAIYEHLFKEGVMVAKKDTHLPKHPEIDVPNLQVMKTLNVSTYSTSN